MVLLQGLFGSTMLIALTFIKLIAENLLTQCFIKSVELHLGGGLYFKHKNKSLLIIIVKFGLSNGIYMA